MASYLVPRNAAASLGRSTHKSSLIGVPGRESWDLNVDKDQLIGAYMPSQAVQPPAYPAFRFEARRTRIDWRILHGVDVESIVRNTDLDLLERIVSTVAHGDIEAEDTRHLTELNFLKIFRLAQLVIEYLLYVQDQLQATNTWLQTDRIQLERYISSLRTRLREIDIHYKSSKRELRRARRTAKTYETMVAMGKLPGDDKADAKTEPKSQAAPSPEALAAEMAMRQQLLVLGERLFRTQEEASQLRAEREDMMGVLREVDTALRTKGSASKAASDSAELRSAKEQLSKAHADFKMLKAEKDEVVTQLQSVQYQVKVLQGEKEALLVEMASRSPKDESQLNAKGGSEQEGGGSQLSSMLLEAEARNKVLAQQVQELQGTVSTLQKQLMKAAKDAAIAAKEIPGSSSLALPTDELQRALSAAESSKADLMSRVHELEHDLADKRKAHAQDVKALQDELDLYHNQLSVTRQQLAAAQSKGTGAEQTDATSQQLAQALKECDTLQSQVSEMRVTAARQAVALSSKEEALATAWKLVKELQAQLSVPAANRDAEASGRVQAQVIEFERMAELSGVRKPSTAASLAAGLPAAVVEAVAALKTAASLTTSESAMSIANSSFKFSKPAQGQPRAGQESGSGVGGGSGSFVHQGADTPNAKRALAGQRGGGSPQPSSVIKAELLRRLSGRTAEDVAQFVEKELRVLTEHPFEYQEDDEQQFREVLPYEVVGGAAHGGMLSRRPHGATDHALAMATFGPAVLSAVDDELTSYGIDPRVGALSDREYGAVMLELAQRRATAWAKLDDEGQKQADFLREALLTHLELVRRKAETASGQAGGQAASLSFPEPVEYVASFPPVQGSKRDVQGLAAEAGASVAAAMANSKVANAAAPEITPASAPVQKPKAMASIVEAAAVAKSLEKPPVVSPSSAVVGGSSRAVQPEIKPDQSRDTSPPVAPSRDSTSSPDLPASRLLPASNLTTATDSPTQAASSPLNQSLRSAAAAAQSGNPSPNRSVSPFSAFPGGSLNQSLSKAAGSLNQSMRGAASNAAQALNQSLTSSAAQSPLSRPAGVASPAATAAASQSGGGQLNQSLRQGSAAAGLNATNASTGGASLGRTLSKQLAAVQGIAAMNQSIRSSGTAKASLRDYSTNDFDNDDDDDDSDEGEQDTTAGKRGGPINKADIGGGGGGGGGGDDDDEDEYALDEDEGEEVDEGLAGDSPPVLPAAASGWAPNTTSGRADNNQSLPSRLARMTGAGEESPQLPPTTQDTPAGDDDEEWDVSEDGYHKLPSGSGKQAGPGDVQQPRAGILKNSLPPAAPAWLSEGPTPAPSEGNSQTLPKHRPSSEGSDAFDLGSIHSFHPNDTAASGRRAASAVPSALMKPGAWGSPDTTLRSRRAEALAAGTPTAQGSEVSLPSTSKWNETIQTIGSIAGEDNNQGFKEQAQQSFGRGSAQWVIGAIKPGGQAAGGARAMGRQGSFDTVSEMDLN